MDEVFDLRAVVSETTKSDPQDTTVTYGSRADLSALGRTPSGFTEQYKASDSASGTFKASNRDPFSSHTK